MPRLHHLRVGLASVQPVEQYAPIAGGVVKRPLISVPRERALRADVSLCPGRRPHTVTFGRRDTGHRLRPPGEGLACDCLDRAAVAVNTDAAQLPSVRCVGPFVVQAPAALSDADATMASMPSFSLTEVERAIRQAWTHETTYAKAEYLARAADRPSRGQCGTTALVVQDLLGGDLLVADLSTGGVIDGVHYWNRLSGGVDIDFTRDQFTVDEVVLQARVIQRSSPPRDRRANVAYLLLRGRVFNELGIPTE
jgi:hypothetical protein